jgi:hypothetical protein
VLFCQPVVVFVQRINGIVFSARFIMGHDRKTPGFFRSTVTVLIFSDVTLSIPRASSRVLLDEIKLPSNIRKKPVPCLLDPFGGSRRRWPDDKTTPSSVRISASSPALRHP